MALDRWVRGLGKLLPSQDVAAPVRQNLTVEQHLAGLAEALPAGDEAVMARLAALEADHPGDDLAATHAARQLGELGRRDLAETWLTAWLETHRGLWSERELAQLFRLRGDDATALAHYLRICETYPDQAVGFAAGIELLMNAGRLDEAAAMAEAQLPRFATDTWLWDAGAVLAEKAGDPVTAYARWQALRRFDPHHPRAVIAMARLLTRLRKGGHLDRLMVEPEVELGVLPVGDLDYRVPSELSVSRTPLRRALVIGSCLVSGLPAIFAAEGAKVETDFILVNNAATLPDAPPHPLADYDFQFVQIPLRAVLPDGSHFALAYDRPEGYEALFDACCGRITRMLDALLAWNRDGGLLTFVSNFLLPQQNAMGRLLPRYDLRNFVHFTEKLNAHLAAELARFSNAHLVDTDQIAATLGRRFLQDDMVWVTGHASLLSDADHVNDRARLEPLNPVQDYYPSRIDTFASLLWREVEAMYRSIQQVDSVKMVLVDLDDTLWRGVLAETGGTEIEGWPVGLAEALMFLRRRGVILGIVSKNSEDRIRELWPFERLMPLDSFAVRRIDWQPKAGNIADILAEVNLLPKSVVFIDDNPVERASVQAAFPEMRVLGANPYLLRRILLWSAETQGAGLTAESARRSEMIKAQGEREKSRKAMSRGDFLASLKVEISLAAIRATSDPAYARAFELLNKTNQFNTTGQRWTPAEAEVFLARGGVFYALTVSDIYTHYGLVGVLCVDGGEIVQFAMSCRVIGLDVEIAAVAATLQAMQAGGQAEARATVVETAANGLARDIWTRCGFDGQDGTFVRAMEPALEIPAHIRAT